MGHMLVKMREYGLCVSVGIIISRAFKIKMKKAAAVNIENKVYLLSFCRNIRY